MDTVLRFEAVRKQGISGNSHNQRIATAFILQEFIFILLQQT